MGSNRKLFEIIEWMYAAKSMDALHESITRGIARMIPGDCYDLVLCQAPKDSGEIFLCIPGTYTNDEIDFMLGNAMDHPIAKAYAGGATGALSVSQCGSVHRWQKSPLYNEGGYRRLGLLHELAVEIPGIRQSSLATFSVVRGGRDYSEEEGEILNVLRPHIARAWMLAQRRGLELSPEVLGQMYPVLTRREAEVLFWILEGKQNAEIAAILERRLGTIQEHVERVVHKLGMENRHQMTVSVLKSWHETQGPG